MRNHPTSMGDWNCWIVSLTPSYFTIAAANFSKSVSFCPKGETIMASSYYIIYGVSIKLQNECHQYVITKKFAKNSFMSVCHR